MIENTTQAMEEPGRRLAFLAASLRPDGPEPAILEQERAGQAQLVNSECLPTDLSGDDRSAFEALGIRFGEPVDGDPLFQHATLLEGWTKQASDRDMWSYVLDQHGRRRISVFYKAAFYDRRAHMRLSTVDSYVGDCVRHDKPIVTDDIWATAEAVREACLAQAKSAEESIALWQGDAERRGDDETSRKYVAEYTAERDKYEALAAEFGPAAEA